MFLVIGLIFAAFLSPLDSTKNTCKRRKTYEFKEGQCPVRFSPCKDTDPFYLDCVTVSVWITDLSQAPVIDINKGLTLQPTLRGNKRGRRDIHQSKRISCKGSADNSSSSVWEVKTVPMKLKRSEVISVFFKTNATSCSFNYTSPDPVPNFHLSIDRTSKSVFVSVEMDGPVIIRWCYKLGETIRTRTLDPGQNTSVQVTLPHMLPCVCVEVYYTFPDARRNIKCPFENDTVSAARDVLLSSEFTPFHFGLQWNSKCPTANLEISASLCWRNGAGLCILSSDSTLKGTKRNKTIMYGTSAVDKHPQMCLQLSLHQNNKISCHFKADAPSWEASIEPSRRSMMVHLTPSTSANFSAQLCVLKGRVCEARGPIVSARLEVNGSVSRLVVSLHDISEQPCVQVWQSDPALLGRRILCPNYSASKSGLVAVAALFVVTLLILVVIWCHSSAKNSSTADWLLVQKPVLLVCSSDQAPHVSAACALASILQGELRAAVHMTLWTQNSGSWSGIGPGVADLGPLPWLYGQWDAVQEADGRILIIWSPEAKQSYRKWKQLKKKRDVINPEIKEEEEEVHERQSEAECHDTAVIQPVFTAALSCLKGALQEGNSQGVSIVYFEGLGHSRDIPKAFRSFPSYCIPQHFRGLLQELGGTRRPSDSRWRCWTGLVIKMLSFWLSRQLERKLKTLLSQTKDEKTKEKCPLVAKRAPAEHVTL